MDSDSDNDFCSEKAIRKKLEKLVRLSRRDNSTDLSINLPDVVMVQHRNFNDDPEDCDEVKVIFPKESPDYIYRLSIQRNDYFVTVFKKLADLKNVAFDCIELVMMPQNRDVSQYDCLDTLNYNPNNCFYAYQRESDKLLTDSRGTGEIELRCVCLGNSLTYRMYRQQPLDILISYCARDFGCDKENIRLIYDKEYVRPYHTCSSLEITSGQTLQVQC